MRMPEISNYYSPSKDNAMRVDIGNRVVWFSYKTPIAFLIPGYSIVVRENIWRQTTGKHLNAIDGGGKAAKNARVSRGRFQELWSEQTKEE